MSVDFIDSNVFIYLFDHRDTRKQAIALGLVDRALAGGQACISSQVVLETLRVLTGRLPRPLTAASAQALCSQTLEPLWRVMPSAALYASARQLKQRWQLAFYDSLIVAAALEAGCKRLFSEDLQHGQRIQGLRIENPFRV